MPEAGMVDLKEFCRDLSTTDKRAHLIGAFYHFQSNSRGAKQVATTAEFKELYEAFGQRPVVEKAAPAKKARK